MKQITLKWYWSD